MRNRLTLVFLICLCGLAAAGCGSIAAPPPSSAELTAVAAEENATEGENENASAAEAVAVVPTETPIPPTATPVPSTATAIPPTATIEATEEAPVQAAQDPIVLLVSRFGNAEHGAELFVTTYNTGAGPYACSTCHNVITDDQLIGPGMYTISDRAANRMPGVAAETYVYNSILNPNEYVVEGFVSGVMPQNYRDLLSDQDLYDLTAYLFSLQGS